MFDMTLDSERYISDAPLYASLIKYAYNSPARFHMPGHAGGKQSPLYSVFGGALGLDVTELPETDNLFDDEGAILEAERLAAQLYGTRETLFSAGGSTLCIQAMLRLVSKGDNNYCSKNVCAGAICKPKIICARNIHRSVVNAMALLGLEPTWVWPRQFEGSGLPGAITPDDIEAAIIKTGGADSGVSASGVSAVFITSPDYYGVISDIAGISAVCRRHNLPLLVDNAHGAHLSCLDGTLHPIALGADMCCDSAHKTLPALTGGAFLQINSPLFSRGDAKEAMTLFGSTSPSYLIMLSLDLARAWMARDGKAAFAQLARRAAATRQICTSYGFFTPREAVFDPVRLTIDTASRGISGGDAALFLRRHGVSPEMSDSRHLVLLPSPFNTEEDFARLEAALLALHSELKTSTPLPLAVNACERPERVLRIREAVTLQSEALETASCSGHIAAEAKCPCPPCVPIVMPGELISEKMAISLKSYGVLKIKVVK